MAELAGAMECWQGAPSSPTGVHWRMILCAQLSCWLMLLTLCVLKDCLIWAYLVLEAASNRLVIKQQ
jgi:hypothetical protein